MLYSSLAFALLAIFLTGCGSVANPSAPPPMPTMDLLPGMPPYPDPSDIYSAARAGMINPEIRNFPARVYVPQTGANHVDVIDPATFKIIDGFDTEKEPQHVTPSYDMKTLYVGNDLGDTLTVVDPATGKKTGTLQIEDPYNLYFTPDGRYSIVVAERMRRLDFRDARTMRIVEKVPVPCKGVDHMDFSYDGKYLIATCEFSGELVKVDVQTRKVVGKITLPKGGMPQDIKLSPDGKVFYVADMENHGMHTIESDSFKLTGFIPTGIGCHGLYVSRDSRHMYVTNRGEGSISLFEFASAKVIQKWRIPGEGGASPDMGGLTADGKQLWISGRYHKEVYVLDTANGQLLARIKVGKGPHGLCVYPQAGRYSIGHTGITR